MRPPPRSASPFSGSRGDCRLKAASQERRLQAADGLHNPANRLTPHGTASAAAKPLIRANQTLIPPPAPQNRVRCPLISADLRFKNLVPPHAGIGIAATVALHGSAPASLSDRP